MSAYRDSGAHEQSEDEGDDIIVGGPKVHVYRIEDGEQRETPANAVNDHLLASLEELVDNGTEE